MYVGSLLTLSVAGKKKFKYKYREQFVSRDTQFTSSQDGYQHVCS